MITHASINTAGKDVAISRIQQHLHVRAMRAREGRREWLEIEGSNSSVVATIRVHAKQKAAWPKLQGVTGDREYLVLVDFKGCDGWQDGRCFVLDLEAWSFALKRRLDVLKREHPEPIHDFRLVNNTPVFYNQFGPDGSPYTGIDFKVEDVTEFADAWGRIKV